MNEGNDGLVATPDKATLPKEGVVAPEFEVTKEIVVELAAPIKGDSDNDCAAEREEETEDNTPKEGVGRAAVDDPNPKRGDDVPPPILGFVTEEVAGAAAEREDDVLERKSDPWLGKEEWVVDKELLKENDEVGPEEKLKVDAVEEEEELTVAAAGVEIELNEYEKGLGADDAKNKLLVAAVDELGFDEELNRDDDENAVEKEEEPNELDCEAEVRVVPKENDGVGLAGAAVAAEDEKIGEAAEEKENGEEDDDKELEEIEKENTGD